MLLTGLGSRAGIGDLSLAIAADRGVDAREVERALHHAVVLGLAIVEVHPGDAGAEMLVASPVRSITAAVAAAQPDWIQLHGTENTARAAEVRPFARRGLIKAVGIATAEDFKTLPPYYPIVDYFLFDAQVPKGGLPGGNALAFDWKVMAGAQLGRPWFLAGGLNPTKVTEAIQVSGADFVDVSSGVESRPGLKDPALIAQFLAAAEV